VIGGWSTDATSLYAFVDDPSITAWDSRFDGGLRSGDDHPGPPGLESDPGGPADDDRAQEAQ
jgi:hypothetical protein